ncbi:hypothetical protein CPB83DRAFT_850031 [Crepidotus variabilis]|uniref:Uncharacterized protein n=1 Tax=Crepidotus variabilis TaxID=179855 RepID=A0A9P6JSJ6_9AGAR|nr:hypothetical protein CPB83DRAFT_850031 [Crepidotus variabilis]
MPRIRKQTSNRLKTHDREKVKKKIKETKRKKTKLAKKNPQWKSKKPKDPGIPNDFPYKDQILAEVQDQRRLDAEEKQKKKQEKQKSIAKAKAIALGEDYNDLSEDEAMNEGGSDEEHMTIGLSSITKNDLNVGAESIASLSAKTLNTKLKPRPRIPALPVEEDESQDEVPVLMNRDLPNFDSVLNKADVILEVLDARDPLSFHSKHIEDFAKTKGKKFIYVLSKIDRCPREAVASWSTTLRAQHPTFLFRAATAFLPEEETSQMTPQNKSSKGKGKVPVHDAIGSAPISSCLAEWAKEIPQGSSLTVAVVGLVNVGKSSLVNSLLHKSALATYTLTTASQAPSTTELPQEVTLEVDGQTITVIDTPGLSFVYSQDEEEPSLTQNRVRDILLRSRGRIDKLKDPIPAVSDIVLKANNEDLLLLYSLAAFTKGDTSAFLSGVARAHHLVKKKGELDLTGAARIVLRDWSIGKFQHYTTPVGNLNTESTGGDASILKSLPTRRDMRRNGGLVKMSPGTIEERAVDVEKTWVSITKSEDDDDDSAENDIDLPIVGENSDDEETSDEAGESGLGESSDVDDEQDDSDEEDDVVPAVAPVSRKQKRKRETEAPGPRPPKKVSLGRTTILAAKGKSSSQQVSQSQTQLTKMAGPKSILKKAADSSSKGGVKKADNSMVATKSTPLAAVSAGTETEAYDFGKFF